MCGTPCHARRHPALSPEMGLKVNTSRAKVQWHPAGYAYRLVSYKGVWVTPHGKEYLWHRCSPSWPLWMTMC